MIGLGLFAAACSSSEQQALALAAQAQAQAQAGNLGSARLTIAQAISERDDIADIYLIKGQLDLQAKAFLEAYDAFSEALSLDATNLQALQLVAQLALALGRMQEAEEAADRILALDPGQPDATFVKGVVKLAKRDPEAAGKLAADILENNPRDPRGLVLKARVLYSAGRTAEAIALLEENSVPATRNDLVARTIVELYRDSGRAAPALAELARINARHPDDDDARIDRINMLYKTGRVAEARTQAARLLTRKTVSLDVIDKVGSLWHTFDPDPFPDVDSGTFPDNKARMAVSHFYLLQGRTDRALAVLAGSRTRDAEALRVRILMSRKPDASLAEQANRILVRDKTHCDALVARAEYRRTAGETGGAISDVRRALAECPGDAGAVLELAAVYRDRGDRNAEYRAYDDGLATDPQSVPVSRAYFRRSLQVRDVDRARAVARRLTRAAPSAPAGWAMLVQVCGAAPDDPCLAEARTGLARARASLTLDPRPGQADRGGPLAKLTR